MAGPAGFLHHHRATQGQIAGAPAAKPAGLAGHVSMLGHTPFPGGTLEKRAVGEVVRHHLLRLHQIPAQLAKSLRGTFTVHSQTHGEAQFGGSHGR